MLVFLLQLVHAEGVALPDYFASVTLVKEVLHTPLWDLQGNQWRVAMTPSPRATPWLKKLPTKSIFIEALCACLRSDKS